MENELQIQTFSADYLMLCRITDVSGRFWCYDKYSSAVLIKGVLHRAQCGRNARGVSEITKIPAYDLRKSEDVYGLYQ